VVEVSGALSSRLSDFTPQHLISDLTVARVYQARHSRTGQPVALKVWRQASHLLSAGDRTAFTEQFHWLVAASRDTGRVVRCHAAGLDGFPWVAMDLCDGSLAEIDGGQDGVGVELARDSADALLTVVRRLLRDGKVHGRLSPSNLLVVRGRVVLGDFGMLPESWQGRAVDPTTVDDLSAVAALVLDLLPDNVVSRARQVLTDVAMREPGIPADEDITAIRMSLGLAPERGRPSPPTAPPVVPEPAPDHPSVRATSGSGTVGRPPVPGSDKIDPEGPVDLDRQVTRLPEPVVRPDGPAPGPRRQRRWRDPSRRTAVHAPVPPPVEAPAPRQPPPRGAVSPLRMSTPITMNVVRVRQEEGPGLLILLEGKEHRLSPGAEAMIGRGPAAQIRVLDPLVSRRHARVHCDEDGWRITDSGSSNGVWRDGIRISDTTIGASPVRVRVGGPHGPELTLAPQPVPDAPSPPSVPEPAPLTRTVPDTEDEVAPASRSEPREPQLVATTSAPGQYDLPLGSVVIGRAPNCGLVLEDLLISRRHAELRRTGDRATLVDLHSANGTFVNGERVRRSELHSGDLIGFGGFTLRFEGTRLVEVDSAEGVEFGTHGLSVLVDGKRLLTDVSFRLPPRSLMAIVGPSGAGKSTLLNALAGLRPATAGQVLYGGRDLYRNYGELRQRIGYVPQQDILHPGLTLEQALDYGARLRFPAETSAEERAGRISEVVDQLSLTKQFHTRIDQLSGGERKRAGTAVELITRPSLLFLDEPTSGLDVDLDRDVMQQLRGLADDGRTVIVVTHNLEHLSDCDVVMVMARGGRVAYLGPPDGVFDHFRVRDWADAFAAMKASTPGRLASNFLMWSGRDSRSYPPKPLDVTAGDALAGSLPSLPSRPSFRGQLLTLIRRQLAVIASDRTLVGLLVLLPAGIALIARGIPPGFGLSHSPQNKDAIQILLVLIVGAALMGAAAATRELVKERSIYLRERAVGVSWVAYLGSKIVVLSVIGALQAAVMTVLALIGREPPDNTVVTSWWMLEIGFVIATVTVVSVIMGLVISALVQEESQGMPLLVLFTMGQLVGSGGVVPVVGAAGLEQFAWFMPARWSFAATAATVDLQYMHPELPLDAHWNHNLSSWRTDVLLLVLLGFLATVVVAALVRRLDPRRPRDVTFLSRLGFGPRRGTGSGHENVSDDVIAGSST
jgi:ABC-type multidrug transport system ATPase subunit